MIVGFFRRNFLILSAATANRNVPQGAALCPIPSTSLAEVAWLREAVVVVVTKFSVC